MVDAGRGAPGLVAGGPDDIAICVGQFPGCAQVVRMHMQSLALQRLGGGVIPAARSYRARKDRAGGLSCTYRLCAAGSFRPAC